MRIKLLILFVLAALASGTCAWAAVNANAEPAARVSHCCGFCAPGKPCCGFCDSR